MLPFILTSLITTPQIRGSLDKEVIRRVIRSKIHAIAACIEGGGVPSGMALAFVIGPDGRVTLSREGLPKAAVSCLERVVASMRFPAPKGGGTVSVRYPLLFRASGEGDVARLPPRQPDRSTFSIDVDTGSYTLARRNIREGRLPRPEEVRVEELINFFRYDYDPPIDAPFSIQIDGSRSPVNEEAHLLRIGIQARIVSDSERLPRNLVFLVDTSCSMSSSDRLDLAKDSMRIALGELDARDQIAVATYAGNVTLVLGPTPGDRKEKMAKAIDSLGTGGATAMASGLRLAYEQAASMLRPKSITRIIVMSDGDANIGATSHEAMLEDVAEHVKKGVRLSTIGFGTGNYRDDLMEQLADRGNGNYFYVDGRDHAEIVFGRDFSKMVEDVAQDVKVQVAFSPAVRSFRLVGYENRALENDAFLDDAVDAGEIGSGHQATALYELVLHARADGIGEDLGTVSVRAKPIAGGVAQDVVEVRRTIERRRVDRPIERAPSDYRATVLVAAAAEVLRTEDRLWTFQGVIDGLRALSAAGELRELATLLEEARLLSSRVDGTP